MIVIGTRILIVYLIILYILLQHCVIPLFHIFIVFITFIIQATALSYIPYIGIFLDWYLTSLIYSFYCWEYFWGFQKISYSKKLRKFFPAASNFFYLASSKIEAIFDLTHTFSFYVGVWGWVKLGIQNKLAPPSLYSTFLLWVRKVENMLS